MSSNLIESWYKVWFERSADIFVVWESVIDFDLEKSTRLKSSLQLSQNVILIKICYLICCVYVFSGFKFRYEDTFSCYVWRNNQRLKALKNWFIVSFSILHFINRNCDSFCHTQFCSLSRLQKLNFLSFRTTLNNTFIWNLTKSYKLVKLDVNFFSLQISNFINRSKPSSLTNVLGK